MDESRPIPRRASFDSSLAFRADPYRFITRECSRHGSELFETRLLLQRTICMTGPRAAEIFCDPVRFVRAGATPEPLRATLFGKGGVQELDAAAHRHRKAMLMSLMTPQHVERMAARVDDAWQAAMGPWTARESIVFYEELKPLLLRAACAWADVPLAESELPERCRQLSALYEQAGSVGAGHFEARLARRRAEAWLADVVERLRGGHLEAPVDGVLGVVAMHRELNGRLLRPRAAAVELLNLLRPAIATAVFVVFVAHALHAHPDSGVRLRAGEADYLGCFVDEVRRFYPFFPAVAARVRDDFEWHGYAFERGTRALLDLYGTDHDPGCWTAPEAFSPERFRRETPSAWAFIPQGGGDSHVHHRCAGEPVVVALMKLAAMRLAAGMRYEVPAQDLAVDFAAMPALPRDRFVMRGVRAT